jgi:uncharacterized protein (TIGR02453 family)
MAFDGFPADAVKFLAALEKNNNRQWFQANKARYEQSVRGPAIAFIEAVSNRLDRIAPHIYCDPSPSGGSLMRIYRDIRFSSDKRPYKTNIGIQFRHERGDDVHAPGLYFHIDAKEAFLACGMWRPDGPALAAVRKHIVEHPDRWRQVKEDRAFVKVWGQVTGDRLKRPPRGFEPSHPDIDDLRLRDFLGVADLSRQEILSPKLVDRVVKAFGAGAPLMKFLCEAIAVPY